MKKAAAFLVEKRRMLFGLFLLLAAVSAVLTPRIKINYDMAEYLPGDSRMKQGMQRMEQAFGPEESSELRVMITGLAEEEKAAAYAWLSGLEGVASVTWEPGDAWNHGEYTLYEITSATGSHSEEAAALYRAVHEKYGEAAATAGTIHDANVPLLPTHMVVIAVGLVLLILLLMCDSWFEPVVLLVNIGIAVVINLGITAVRGSISEYTGSIMGIMQMVLSMDYSIILMNRYTQEREKQPDHPAAMKAAVAAAFPAIAGSSMTTFAGLVCLAFMRFRIGADMGLSLALSVAVSLVCILTVLPSLILMSDKWIAGSRKKAPRIPMGRFSRFADRRRFGFAVVFTALFIGAFFLKNNAGILFTLETHNPVDAEFGARCSLVMLYETKDSGRIAEVMEPFEKDGNVTGITGYYNTVGRAYTAEEIAALFGGENAPDPAMIGMVYRMYGTQRGITGEITMTPAELISFLRDEVLASPLLSGAIDDGTRRQIGEAGDMLRENAARLEGEQYGRVILTTAYPEDSAETRAFIASLQARCESLLEGETWLIGASPMYGEMASSFDAELNRITLLSAFAIFLIVALTFRSLILPLALVMTVQCGIYLTMAFIGLSGGGIFYLALLMVQCILMGATIDYGILYTSCYREHRLTAGRAEALSAAADSALPAVLTSAMIMIAAPGLLGFMFANPTIGEICLNISRGAIFAALMIVFILPGVLAALDRFVRRSSRRFGRGRSGGPDQSSPVR